jgi:proline-rich tail region repeat protein
MSRYRAAAIHLGLSALIFCALAYLVLFVWYPDFFFETDGGWEGMRIIILVDLVIGPLLTLIVFKASKPGLKFDLSVVAAIQAGCLVAGVWIVHDERPIAMVFVDGQFFSLSADDFREANVGVPSLEKFPGQSPKWITVDVPADPEEQSKIRTQMLRSGIPLRLATERYIAFDSSVIATTEPAEYQHRFAVPAILPHAASARFYPFGSRYVYGLIGFETATGRVVGVIDPEKPGSQEMAAEAHIKSTNPLAPAA